MGAGPVAALAAAVPLVRAAVVVTLAADLPFVAPAVPVLLGALADADVAVLVDRTGRRSLLAVSVADGRASSAARCGGPGRLTGVEAVRVGARRRGRRRGRVGPRRL